MGGGAKSLRMYIFWPAPLRWGGRGGLIIFLVNPVGRENQRFNALYLCLSPFEFYFELLFILRITYPPLYEGTGVKETLKTLTVAHSLLN